MHGRDVPRRGRLRPALVAAACLLLCGYAAPAGAADTTAQEQLFLYEVNRARNDPPAWAIEMGIDEMTGGDGEPADLEDVTPMPPLALNGDLVESSRFHAEEMATHN